MSLAFSSKYKGGVCYAACADLYSFYNPSVVQCRKGCDFARGRANDEEGRAQSERMCRLYTSETYITLKGQLDAVEDLRVQADTFPDSPENLYRVCLSGVRRQEY